ncbi:hypothetical protein CSB09_00780 [Candidatus Gracilibacteria bacterium]|nr:MAG: hypothetical protein CSB09_00780 [Candidatus Gracilibacteria bacterium]
MYRYLSFLAIVFVSLSACTNQSSMPQNTGQGDQKNSPNQKESKQSPVLAPELQNSQNYQSCIQEQTQYCAAKAGNELAREKNDTKFCEYIGDETQVENCKFGIIFGNALKEKNSKRCEDIKNKDQQKSCVLAIEENIALESGDIKNCEKIATVIQKYQDTDAASGSVSSAITNHVENCKFNILQKSGTFSKKDCEQIQDEFIKEECMVFAETPSKETPSKETPSKETPSKETPSQ